MSIFKDVIADVKGFGETMSGFGFECTYKKKFPRILKERSAKAKPGDYDVLVTECLQSGENRVFETIMVPIFDSRKCVNWKKNLDMLRRFLAFLKDCPNNKDIFYNTAIECFCGAIKSYHLENALKDDLFSIIERDMGCSEEEHPIHTTSFQTFEVYPWKTVDEDTLRHVISLMKDRVHENPELPRSSRLHLSVDVGLILILRYIKKNFIPNIRDDLLEIFTFCADQEFHVEGKETLSYSLCKTIMEDYLYINNSNTALLKPFMDTIKTLKECGEEIMERDADNIITAVAGNAELLGDDASKTIDTYLDGENTILITEMAKLYRDKPELFNGRIEAIAEAMTFSEEWVKTTTLSFFTEVVKNDPQEFTQRAIDIVAESLKTQSSVFVAFTVLQHLAEKRPHDVVKHDKLIISTMNRLGNMGFQGALVLVELAPISEQKAKYYMDVIAGRLKQATDQYKIGLLHNMRTIGHVSVEALQAHRSLIESYLKDNTLKDSAQYCIDLIEGHSLAAVSKDVEEQKQDIDDLGERVDRTDENVENLGKEVDDSKKDIKRVKKDVQEQTTKLDILGEVVEETVEKVEDLDHKTLSHAPIWSRDVAHLMNTEDEADWRLLAARLGYSNDDIRNWATQPNPCLSMFDEWFATHKTKEATFAVKKNLEEINRMDAAEIVDDVLKAVDDVVEDTEEGEEIEPPPVFISYQWGHQQEVKLLRQHLGYAGYKAWMDIGQMGGGDKLFAKIDQGIRAAKVIICCVSNKYAQSANCNREVNLSVTLGKPIIPLLMEKMSWPPPGTMGPIFSEYIFVRFFQRQGEESGDTRYWPAPKFDELLMQLRMTIPPDTELLTPDSMYNNWWNPPEEIIVIKPRDHQTAPATQGSKTEDDSAPASPDVFISYQWGKQPQIKALYRKLTSLGYTCWLDIMQMGGGDSLYDKIDRGVRGCRVVVSCVTSKYALSANCRREVSLADATKKPIIPILLEKMSWPPEGPMGMVLTQLLYIQFYKPDINVQDKWDCPQFDELLIKLNEQVPSMDDTYNSENQNENIPQNNKPQENKLQENKPERDDVPQKDMQTAPVGRKKNKEVEDAPAQQENRKASSPPPPKRSHKSSMCYIL